MEARRVRNDFGCLTKVTGEGEEEGILFDGIAHEDVSELRELVASETLGEKISNVLIRADMKHTKNAIFDEITQSIPTGRQCLRRVHECSNRVPGRACEHKSCERGPAAQFDVLVPSWEARNGARRLRDGGSFRGL